MEYKVIKEEIRYDELKEQADETQRKNKLLAEEKAKLVQECDTLSTRAAVRQMDYDEANEKAREACGRADRMEVYLKKQKDAMEDLEERNKELFPKAELAEKVYEMMRGSDGDTAIRDKLVDVMYENEQLKAENGKR